jgi:hypothetical protein
VHTSEDKKYAEKTSVGLVYDRRDLAGVMTARPGVARVLQMASEHYSYNTSCPAIFLKTYGEDTRICPYKDYSSPNRW